jgi:hypothetical protein
MRKNDGIVAVLRVREKKVISTGADTTGAIGTFVPVLMKILGQEYSFDPVLFGRKNGGNGKNIEMAVC